MKQLLIVACAIALTLVAASDAGAADRGGDRLSRRAPEGGINSAPLPGQYVVVSIDPYNRIVQMQAPDGSTVPVQVGENVYSLSKLSVVQKVQVSFLEPDGKGSPLKAANIWPLQ